MERLIEESRTTTPMSNDEIVENLKTMVFGAQAFYRFNAKERETLDKAWNIIDQYENRLKADMVAMLTEIQLEIEEYQKIHDSYCDHYIKDDVWAHHTREHYDSSSGKAIACDYCLKTIQKKIDKLKEK